MQRPAVGMGALSPVPYATSRERIRGADEKRGRERIVPHHAPQPLPHHHRSPHLFVARGGAVTICLKVLVWVGLATGAYSWSKLVVWRPHGGAVAGSAAWPQARNCYLFIPPKYLSHKDIEHPTVHQCIGVSNRDLLLEEGPVH